MLTELISNPINEVVIKLGTMIAVFIPLLIATVEGAKSIFDLKGKSIQYFAMGANFFFGSMFVVVFFIPAAAKIVGIVIFMIMLIIAPLGGYDLLKNFIGKKNDGNA